MINKTHKKAMLTEKEAMLERTKVTRSLGSGSVQHLLDSLIELEARGVLQKQITTVILKCLGTSVRHLMKLPAVDLRSPTKIHCYWNIAMVL